MESKEFIKQIGSMESRIKGLERQTKSHASCINMMGTHIGDLTKRASEKDKETYPDFIKKHYGKKKK